MFERYGFLGVMSLIFFKIRTLFLFRNARIIRFPFNIRGRRFVTVGKGFTTGYYCRIDAFPQNLENGILISIGDNVQINDSVHIGAIRKVSIGNNVLIASNVFITDHNHGSYKGDLADSPLSIPHERKLEASDVIISDNVWIGEYVCILPGVVIGEGCIIGAMSVVNKDIPAYSIAVGAPAKVIKKYNFDSKRWEKI
ncbi:acetyltransferase [Myroides sp. TSA_177.3]|uniref:acetyltransferase n=1 Tax=Myroides sp. TSA_177.3 TaxID=3415650 RepID=UPI00404587F1